MRLSDPVRSARERWAKWVFSSVPFLLAPDHALAQRYEARLLDRPSHFFIVEVANINNHGEMVGSAYQESEPAIAVLYRADSSVVELPYVPDNPTDPSVNAYGINDGGEIVGRSSVGAIPGVAVMWPKKNEVVRLLRGSSVAVDINELGAVIEYRETELFHFQGFLWGQMGWSAMLPLLQMQYDRSRGEGATASSPASCASIRLTSA